jgi:hypothetical protein
MRGGSGAQEGEADAALHSPPDHRVLVLTSSGQQCGAEVKRRCGGLDVQPGAAANAWTQGGSAVIHCVRRPASPGPGSAVQPPEFLRAQRLAVSTAAERGHPCLAQPGAV